MWLVFFAGFASACVDPDCDRVDEGSCLNACCKLSWALPSYAGSPLDFARNVSALLRSGGPDGRFLIYENTPPEQMWSDKGTYVVQGNHWTEKMTYEDLVQVAVESTSDGLVAYGFSHSQDLIPGEFAWSDFGQNYKNLALIIKALNVEYVETTLFGCPEPQPSETQPALPAWAVAAWERDFEQYGPTNSTDTSVYYVQGSTLFSDCRVPKDRPASLRDATSLADYDEDDLAWLAQSSGFAGGTSFAAFAAGGAWPGNLTWHHALTDYQNVCVDPAEEWPLWLDGTHVSYDVGAIQIMDADPANRLLHEHGYPVDKPVQQYEQWRALTLQGAPELAIVWPREAAAPTSLLVVVGDYFAYARDRPVHATSDCSLTGILNSKAYSLDQKRAFFDVELSFGTVASDSGIFTIKQSTLPFREGQRLGHRELCRPGGRQVGELFSLIDTVCTRFQES